MLKSNFIVLCFGLCFSLSAISDVTGKVFYAGSGAGIPQVAVSNGRDITRSQMSRDVMFCQIMALLSILPAQRMWTRKFGSKLAVRPLSTLRLISQRITRKAPFSSRCQIRTSTIENQILLSFHPRLSLGLYRIFLFLG